MNLVWRHATEQLMKKKIVQIELLLTDNMKNTKSQTIVAVDRT